MQVVPSRDISSYNVKGDNRNIADDTNQQKLTSDKIEALKDQGTGGQGIINQLIENSATFGQKTQFSQAKWLKKKAQKYLVTIQIIKPSALELCDTYHTNYPDKICGLRPDNLGYLLNMSNANSQSRVLFVDNTRGLL